MLIIVRSTLLQDVLELTARNNEATDEFNAVMGRVPRGLPSPRWNPTNQERLHQVIHCPKRIMKAHTRLDEFFGRGVVPEESPPDRRTAEAVSVRPWKAS